MTTSAFGRGYRLTKACEFSRVFELSGRKEGMRLTGPNLRVYVCCNGTGRARLGLAIPKKLVRRAVDRNRVKRVVREDFRRQKGYLRGLDVIVMARPGLADVPADTIRAQLGQHWHRVRRN